MLNFAPGPLGLPSFGSFPIQIVTPTGVFTSMIGGQKNITLNTSAHMLILASGQVINNFETTNTPIFILRVDGTQVQDQVLQVPPSLGIGDGEVFSFVYLTGLLLAGVHTIDILVEQSGISSSATSGALFFQLLPAVA
jgi:hypothetical protein